MRPEEKWLKKPKDPNEKRKRPPRKRSKKTKGSDQPTSDSQARQDSTGVTDGSSPADGANDAEEEFEDAEPEPPAKRPRAQSAEPSKSPRKPDETWENQDAVAALQRAIQASPAGRMGSERVPIQLDESPSTRRLLFPSPRKEGEAKTLDNASLPMTSPTKARKSPPHGRKAFAAENGSPTALQRSPQICDAFPASVDGSPTALRRSPRLNRQHIIPDEFNKENDPPEVEDDDGLGHLFDDGDIERLSTPTPVPSASRPRFETPSPAAKAAQLIVTPGQKSAHVKEVMKLMRVPAEASPLEARNISDTVKEKHRISPASAALAQLLAESCRSNAYAHQATPSKPRSKPSSTNQTPDSQPPDPSTMDLSQLDDLGPDFYAGDLFGDDPFTTGAGGNEQVPTVGEIVNMTEEEEQDRIAKLMGWESWEDRWKYQMPGVA
jgi:hypothetical protein